MARKIKTEVIYICFSTCGTILKFNNRCRDFSEPLIRKPYYCRIFDVLMSAQKIFNLYGINIFTTGNYNILFYGLRDR